MFTLKELKANNGATINKAGDMVNYARGYQVSHEDLYIIPVYKLRKAKLLETLNALLNGDHLGVWIDHNKAYIDRSELITNKRKAIMIGKERCQKAIYNWKTGDCIPCCHW